MTRPHYMERALFVVGERDSGKSTQLRSMFGDLRFGQGGKVPTTRKIVETIHLGNERRLHIRLTSPHETGESLTRFFEKLEKKTGSGRWCFAGALQPTAAGSMPDLEKTVRAFVKQFSPERVRVCLLSPDRRGRLNPDQAALASGILRVNRAEFAAIDARRRTANSLFLADFFDFS